MNSSDENQYITAFKLVKKKEFYKAELSLLDLYQKYPNNHSLINNVGVFYAIKKDLKNSLIFFRKASNLDKSNIEYLFNLANSLYQNELFDEALIAYQKLLNKKNTSLINHKIGLCYFNLNNFEKSINYLKKALKDNLKSDSLLYDLGVVYEKSYDFENAYLHYQKFLNIKLNHLKASNNCANCLKHLHKFDEAISTFEELTRKFPNESVVFWNYSLLKLLLGDFEHGLKMYEHRLIKDKPEINNLINLLNLRKWNGENNLSGKTILILTEQGLGDYIQFSRFFSFLNSQGAKIIINPPQTLQKLIKTMVVDFHLLDEAGTQKIDYYCHLMSLPYLLGIDNNNIPKNIPYLFPAIKKSLILKKSKLKKIGIVFEGSKEHSNDKLRSIKIDKFDEIFNLPFEFHSLQINNQSLTKEYNQIIKHDDEIIDLYDTSSLIQQMDLIISVDTAIAHLAGALNKEVWILLPFTPDFRWMLNSSNTPWYPSAKLYRQKNFGDWNKVLEEVKKSLLLFSQ